MKNNHAFTLIEVLIALVVTMIIMAGAYTAFNGYQKQTTIQTNVSDAQQTLRAAMDFMVRDIRMAGYDPKGIGGFGIENNEVDIDGDGTKESNRISDINGMSAIAFTWDNPYGPTERNYYIDTSSVAPNSTALMLNGDPLAGYIVAMGLAYAYDTDVPPSSGAGKLDQNGGNTVWAVANGSTWLDLDTNGDGEITKEDDTNNDGTINGAPLSTVVKTKTIRAVRIWMLAQSRAQDPNYTDTKSYVVGSRVITPNNHFRHRLLERTVLCRNMGL